jgi:hypothetical protein
MIPTIASAIGVDSMQKKKPKANTLNHHETKLS